MTSDTFLTGREAFATAAGHPGLYEWIDQFALYAGVHTIGNKLVTYEWFKRTVSVPGDIAEFGCWKGSNLLFLAKLKSLLQPHSPKKIYGFDSFEGLPSPSPEDGVSDIGVKGRYRGDVNMIEKAVELFGLQQTVELVRGDVRETVPAFQQQHPELMLSFAYLDLDLYEPSIAVLDLIEDSISLGGIVVFDQAGTEQWPGETLATKQFLQKTNHAFEPLCNPMSRQPTLALIRTA